MKESGENITINSVWGSYIGTTKDHGSSRYTSGLQHNSLTITPEKPTYTLSFSVTNGTEAIAGAQISISGQTITTAENGQASIELEDGDYTYIHTA